MRIWSGAWPNAPRRWRCRPTSLRRSEQGRSLALVAGNMGSWDFDAVSGSWFWDEGQSRIFGVDHASFTPDVEAIRQGIHPEDLDSIRRML